MPTPKAPQLALGGVAMVLNNKHSQFLSIVASVCMVLSFIRVVQAAPKSALVTHLPDFTGNFPSKHYAGYIDIDNKHLYYYFVQSERSPVNDPVVLWLNGGPGCSSIGGFVYEHGPFDFKAEQNITQLHLNQYSWSKFYIRHLDSPAGVGFSYSDNTSDYSTGDLKTASDTHIFLTKWFQQYPEFLGNPFYVSGESYAGIYVPTLASAIISGNEAGRKPVINLKGYIIGNGVADPVFDGDNALVPFARGMGLISEDMYKGAESACNGSYYNPEGACVEQLKRIHRVLMGLNIYNILEPLPCFHRGSGKSALPPSFTNSDMKIRPFKAPWPQLISTNGVPCVDDDDFATMWLYNEDVRKAIHAKPVNVSDKWIFCTRRLKFLSDAGSMLPYHKNLTAKGCRALIYSGDHDRAVPYTGSEAWTKSLGYKIVDEWRSWNVDQQVAGYTQGYANNLTFLTVKGAGHTVPENKPKEALSFYSRWLEGRPILDKLAADNLFSYCDLGCTNGASE